MKLRIRWTTDAATELQDHLDYIADRNPRAAARLVERVLIAEDTIRQWPHSAARDADARVYERWVPGSRLKLVYIVDGEVIEIIAAFHTSRDPQTKPTRR